MKKTSVGGRILWLCYKTRVFQGILAGKGGSEHEHQNLACLVHRRGHDPGAAHDLRRFGLAADRGEYLLVDQGGRVCVYSGDSLISNTGIPVRALPELDRIALAQGIHAKGQRQLAALLEDFGA